MMTLFVLKLIAVGTMLVDHVGAVFFPDHDVFRAVGRIAFPIFAWGIANGYRHTRNVRAYLGRLFLLFVVSQVPYSLLFGTVLGIPFRFNIFFTLVLGLIAIVLFERYRKDPLLCSVIMLALLGVSIILPSGYSVYGVVLILLFHLTYGRTSDMYLWVGLWMIGSVWIGLQIIASIPLPWTMSLAMQTQIQWWALLALPIIARYSGLPGPSRWRWWFYWFYPIHLFVLWCVYAVVH